MLTPPDLIKIPCNPDLSDGAVSHACRKFTHRHLPAGGLPVERLRRMAARTSVELAFRHYLQEQEIPFQVVHLAPFTDPDHYDVALGGHRCELISYVISRRDQVTGILKNPGLLLNAQALIPVEQFAAGEHKPNDILLFAFLLNHGTTPPGSAEAPAPGTPVHLVHPMPEEWAHPRGWEPLQQLVLKSECAEPLSVHLGGMDGGRNFTTAVVELLPFTRTPVEAGFHTLAYLHADRQPTARVGIHSQVRGAAYIIHPGGWEDIQVHAREIWLTGWLTHEQYRNKGSVLKVGARTFQFDHTRVKNLALPVKELNPCAPLFRRVKEWAVGQSGKAMN